MKDLDRLIQVYQSETFNINNNKAKAFYLKQLKNDYLIQAIDFLVETGTTISIDFLYQGHATWDDDRKTARDVYRVTLKNKNSTYTFEFFSSIYDTHIQKKQYTAKELSDFNFNKTYKIRIYDVLACLSFDTSCDFIDFCETSDLNHDSIKDLNTYKAVRNETRALLKLFRSDTHQQLLNDID